MRFAVHGPGCPVASPRMKGAGEAGGVPRRDADGRVDVRVAGETAGSAPEHGLALTRVPVHLPARRAPLARERGTDLLHPARGLVPQPAHQQAPNPHPGSPGSARPWPGRCGPGPPGCLSRTGSCWRSSGPRPGSHRTAAQCRWTLSRPSPCAGPSPGPAAGREPAASHGCSARAAVSCRHCCGQPGAPARPGRQWRCCSTARFHTYRAWLQWSRSTASWAGLGTSRYRDIPTHYRIPSTIPGR